MEAGQLLIPIGDKEGDKELRPYWYQRKNPRKTSWNGSVQMYNRSGNNRELKSWFNAPDRRCSQNIV
jgi:hypothetical protein